MIGRVLAIVVVMMFSQTCFSEQKFNVKDNDTIIAVVSQKELTHLVFEQDEVASVVGVDGEVEFAKKDGKDLFFRVAVTKPINIFVKTKADFVYKMILSPKDIPASQIFVTNKLFKRAKSRNDSTKFLDKKIAQIIKITQNPKNYLGYKFKSKDKKLLRLRDIRQKLVLEVDGDFLYAEKIILSNSGTETISLNKRDFIDGYLAVHLSSLKLKPEGQVTLIRVGKQ